MLIVPELDRQDKYTLLDNWCLAQVDLVPPGGPAKDIMKAWINFDQDKYTLSLLDN